MAAERDQLGGAEPTIVFEDNHLLVLNKPAGMLSQGDTTGDLSAVDWAEHYLRTTYHKPGRAYVALLHRTDRPVGGLLLLAKTGKAAARMSALLQAKQWTKTYLAVVQGHPPQPSGLLVHHLAKLPGKNIVRAYDQPGPNTQRAELTYTLQAQAQGLSLLAVQPITGRQHQIRVQLARLGTPILGDVKYGRSEPLPGQVIALLAWQIGFVHPVTKQAVALEAPWPGYAPWTLFAAP